MYLFARCVARLDSIAVVLFGPVSQEGPTTSLSFPRCVPGTYDFRLSPGRVERPIVSDSESGFSLFACFQEFLPTICWWWSVLVCSASVCLAWYERGRAGSFVFSDFAADHRFRGEGQAGLDCCPYLPLLRRFCFVFTVLLCHCYCRGSCMCFVVHLKTFFLCLSLVWWLCLLTRFIIAVVPAGASEIIS